MKIYTKKVLPKPKSKSAFQIQNEDYQYVLNELQNKNSSAYIYKILYFKNLVTKSFFRGLQVYGLINLIASAVSNRKKVKRHIIALNLNKQIASDLLIRTLIYKYFARIIKLIQLKKIKKLALKTSKLWYIFNLILHKAIYRNKRFGKKTPGIMYRKLQHINVLIKHLGITRKLKLSKKYDALITCYQNGFAPKFASALSPLLMQERIDSGLISLPSPISIINKKVSEKVHRPRPYRPRSNNIRSTQKKYKRTPEEKKLSLEMDKLLIDDISQTLSEYHKRIDREKNKFPQPSFGIELDKLLPPIPPTKPTLTQHPPVHFATVRPIPPTKPKLIQHSPVRFATVCPPIISNIKRKFATEAYNLLPVPPITQAKKVLKDSYAGRRKEAVQQRIGLPRYTNQQSANVHKQYDNSKDNKPQVDNANRQGYDNRNYSNVKHGNQQSVNVHNKQYDSSKDNKPQVDTVNRQGYDNRNYSNIKYGNQQSAKVHKQYDNSKDNKPQADNVNRQGYDNRNYSNVKYSNQQSANVHKQYDSSTYNKPQVDNVNKQGYDNRNYSNVKYSNQQSAKVHKQYDSSTYNKPQVDNVNKPGYDNRKYNNVKYRNLYALLVNNEYANNSKYAQPRGGVNRQGYDNRKYNNVKHGNQQSVNVHNKYDSSKDNKPQVDNVNRPGYNNIKYGNQQFAHVHKQYDNSKDNKPQVGNVNTRGYAYRIYNIKYTKSYVLSLKRQQGYYDRLYNNITYGKQHAAKVNKQYYNNTKYSNQQSAKVHKQYDNSTYNKPQVDNVNKQGYDNRNYNNVKYSNQQPTAGSPKKSRAQKLQKINKIITRKRTPVPCYIIKFVQEGFLSSYKKAAFWRVYLTYFLHSYIGLDAEERRSVAKVFYKFRHRRLGAMPGPFWRIFYLDLIPTLFFMRVSRLQKVVPFKLRKFRNAGNSNVARLKLYWRRKISKLSRLHRIDFYLSLITYYTKLFRRTITQKRLPLNNSVSLLRRRKYKTKLFYFLHRLTGNVVNRFYINGVLTNRVKSKKLFMFRKISNFTTLVLQEDNTATSFTDPLHEIAGKWRALGLRLVRTFKRRKVKRKFKKVFRVIKRFLRMYNPLRIVRITRLLRKRYINFFYRKKILWRFKNHFLRNARRHAANYQRYFHLLFLTLYTLPKLGADSRPNFNNLKKKTFRRVIELCHAPYNNINFAVHLPRVKAYFKYKQFRSFTPSKYRRYFVGRFINFTPQALIPMVNGYNIKDYRSPQYYNKFWPHHVKSSLDFLFWGGFLVSTFLEQLNYLSTAVYKIKSDRINLNKYKLFFKQYLLLVKTYFQTIYTFKYAKNVAPQGILKRMRQFEKLRGFKKLPHLKIDDSVWVKHVKFFDWLKFIRDKKSFFKMKIVLDRIFKWIYDNNKIKYLFGVHFHKKILSTYLLKNTFIYKKKHKVLVS